MEIFRTVTELDGLERKRSETPLILVPTMGALHRGHLSLVAAGVKHGNVVVSIFVNPTQFGPHEDLTAYPRREAEDLAQLEKMGVQAVFVPNVEQMYGDKVTATVQPGPRGVGLCGGDRPGHFAGVLTIVAKLFKMVRPQIAVFGRKDAQQCLVIDEMVRMLSLDVQLVDLPTIREADGLAMSSRNQYLTEPERRRALCLFKSLNAARNAIESGEREIVRLRKVMKAALADADQVEYVEVRQAPDLEELDQINQEKILFAVAARFGHARLIDNMVLDFTSGVGRDSHLLSGMFAE
ncbi:MAG: pantoate--beta-alanine ligase [Candidatus Krumholzibacteriia bacterium]